MTQDLIRYDLLVQDALKGVVRKVLGDATRDGLPGDHHFYVSFRTDFPGVRLSTRMREKYPQDMTIVLQHQFWDLAVTEHALEVGLSFSGVPERLLIPFDAMTGFFDPSVQFGLKFEIQEPPALTAPQPAPAIAELRKPSHNENPPVGEGDLLKPIAARRPAAKPAEAKAPNPRGAASEPEVAEPARAPGARAKSKTGDDKAATSRTADAKASATGKDKATDKAENGAEVVSLDAFRKK